MNTIFKNKNIIMLFILNIILLFILPTSPLYPNYNYCMDDAGIYQLIAKQIINGKILYKEVFDHKGPFIFFIYTIPALLKNINFILFLFDAILINLTLIYSYKTTKIINSKYVSIPIFLSTILIITFSKKILLPEMFMLFTISYLNYWILSKKYLKATFSQLLICGILTGLIFWMKYSLCIYIGIIFIFFIIINIKNKTFNYKHILYPLLGFLIPTIIVLSYFIINNAINDLIFSYFIINMRYGNLNKIETSTYMMLLLILISFLTISSLIKNKKENIAITISYLFLFIISFVLTKRDHGYYYLPFASIFTIIPNIFNINKFKKTLILITSILLILTSVISWCNWYKNYNLSKVTIAQDFLKNENNHIENSMVLFISQTTMLKQAENLDNKYFFTPSLTYEQYPEMWEEIKNKISNKEIKYIIVSELSKENISYNRAFLYSDKTYQIIQEIIKDIRKNYTKKGTYKNPKFDVFIDDPKFILFPGNFNKFAIYQRND